MIRRFLSGYQEFKCVADNCPATCCSGWTIEVDEKSIGKYRKLGLTNVDYTEGVFRQRKNGDCAFLREDGLCQMYMDYGEKSLCTTCSQYPRHVEEFPNIREYSLSVSCPVVAKQLLLRKAPLAIHIVEDGESDEEEYEDFDDALYELLYEKRGHFLRMLQQRERPLKERLENILREIAKTQNFWDQIDEKEELAFPKGKELFLIFAQLEPLQPDFHSEVAQAWKQLENQNLTEWESEFTKAHPECEVWMEQIVTYFFYTYMCGAVYDEYIYSMTAQAVYNAQMLQLLWIVAWKKKGAALEIEEVARILYRYARELEHSTENMILLEQLLNEF